MFKKQSNSKRHVPGIRFLFQDGFLQVLHCHQVYIIKETDDYLQRVFIFVHICNSTDLDGDDFWLLTLQ